MRFLLLVSPRYFRFICLLIFPSPVFSLGVLVRLDPVFAFSVG